MYDTQQQIHTQKVQKKKTAEILTERGNVPCLSVIIVTFSVNLSDLSRRLNLSKGDHLGVLPNRFLRNKGKYRP